MIIFDLDDTLFDKDKPIEASWKVLDDLALDNEIQIWSGRCESVREKTIQWLCEYAPYSGQILKMRPIGDYTPDDKLKHRWLDEYICTMWPKLEPASSDDEGKIYGRKDPIEFVFDSDPDSIKMWRRRGIFVFNCCQHE